MDQDNIRGALIEVFKKHPDRQFDGWELFRKLEVPYSSVLYFKMVAILKDLVMEGCVQKKAGMWKACWEMEEDGVLIKRCLDCGFEQRERKSNGLTGISGCRNCGGKNMWGENPERKVKEHAENKEKEGCGRVVRPSQVQKKTC
jgi:hypothetical protein